MTCDQPPRTGRRAARVITYSLVLLTLLATSLTVGSPASAAAGCSDPEGPSGGTYSVSVCFLTPTGVSPPISGDAPVQTEVTVSGTGNPGIAGVIFRMRQADQTTGRGVYVLSDLTGSGADPDDQLYQFVLPTYRWPDGDRTLIAKVQMSDGFSTLTGASIHLSFQNGGATPWTPHTFHPYVPNPQPSPLVVAAAGDGAIGDQTALDVSNEIEALHPDMFLYLADVYQVGSLAEYYNWYGPAPGNTISCPGSQGCGDYGRFYSITNPTQGVHEYNSPPIPGMGATEAAGYTDYWGMDGTDKHYYSYDASGWHFISLDSTDFFEATPGWQQQYDWLKTDLSANAGTACTIAYWHHPYWGMKTHDENGFPIPGGVDVRLTALYQLLYDNGVDILLTGHQHNFQRWKPLDPSGAVNSAYGITEVVNGAGGHPFGLFTRTDDRLAAGIDRSGDAFIDGKNTGPSPNGNPAGVTELKLYPDHADYRFVLAGGPANGQAFDSATIPCHDAPTDTTPPEPIPGAPTVTAVHAYSSDLAWNASPSSDVAGYNVYRGNGTLTSSQCVNACVQIGTTDALGADGGLTYTDGTTDPSKTYTYAVRTRDTSGNISDMSGTVSTTTPAPLFADDFEGGGFAPGWTKLAGVVVQPDGEDGHAGTYDALASSTGKQSKAVETFDTPQTDLFTQLEFKVYAQQGPVTLLRFQDQNDATLYRVAVGAKGRIRGRDQVSKQSTPTPTNVGPGTSWHRLTVHVNTDSLGSDHVVIWLDGTRLNGLTKHLDLGSQPVGTVQVGDNVHGRNYDLTYDDVKMDGNRIEP